MTSRQLFPWRPNGRSSGAALIPVRRPRSDWLKSRRRNSCKESLTSSCGLGRRTAQTFLHLFKCPDFQTPQKAYNQDWPPLQFDYRFSIRFLSRRLGFHLMELECNCCISALSLRLICRLKCSRRAPISRGNLFTWDPLLRSGFKRTPFRVQNGTNG